MRYLSLFFIYKFFSAWFYSRDIKTNRSPKIGDVFIAAIEENPILQRYDDVDGIHIFKASVINYGYSFLWANQVGQILQMKILIVRFYVLIIQLIGHGVLLTAQHLQYHFH
jgi:hypothetical protein